MAQFLLAYSDMVSRFSVVLRDQYIQLGQPKYHLSKIREAVAESWGYNSFKDLQSQLVGIADASEWHDLHQTAFGLQYLSAAEQRMGPSPFHIRAYRNTIDHFVRSSCLICSIVKDPVQPAEPN